MSLINRAFCRFIEKPRASIAKQQERALRKKLARSRDTFLGERYELDKISSVEGYQARVPVHHYEDMAPHWRRELEGERNITVNEPVGHFVLTTGTTGKCKELPMPPNLLADYRWGDMHLVSVHVRRNPKSKVLSRKNVLLPGSHRLYESSAGIPVGSTSGVMGKTAPWLVARHMIADLETADWSTRLANVAEGCRGQRCGGLYGLCTGIIDFLRVARDVLSAQEFSFFAEHLEMMFTGGINHRIYAPDIYELLGKEVPILEFFGGSEGIYAHEAVDDPNVFEFFYNLGFFEFIPFDDYLQGRYDKRFLMHQLDAGQDYALLITTGNGGLSYAVGDVIESTDPARGRFVLKGRTAATLNVVGEKTSIDMVEAAAMQVFEANTVKPTEFCVTYGLDKARASYLWIMGDGPLFAREGVDEVAAQLDRALAAANPIYGRMRASSLDPLRVVPVSEEALVRFLRGDHKDPGHSKSPRVLMDPKCVEPLIAAQASTPR